MTAVTLPPSILLENAPLAVSSDPPPICPEFGRLYGAWVHSELGFMRELSLAELREHTAHCLRCLKRNNWYAEKARTAIHPDLTAEQIEGV